MGENIEYTNLGPKAYFREGGNSRKISLVELHKTIRKTRTAVRLVMVMPLGSGAARE